MSEDLLHWTDELRNTDLNIDKIYRGGRSGHSGDDPLHHLLGVSNQGGFRILGSKQAPELVVLTTSMNDAEWPDTIDAENGVFTYYGDNKEPGKDLHDTGRYGNHLLKLIFEMSHGGQSARNQVPPILIFRSLGKPHYRDVKFLGLAVPGGGAARETEDLVAIWKSHQGSRFQNYRATFSILNEATINRNWLNAIRTKSNPKVLEPATLRDWRASGVARRLKAVRSRAVRCKEEQLPQTARHVQLLNVIRTFFISDPVRFEKCAARIAELYLGSVVQLNITRPTRDGGYDAFGIYQIGAGENAIAVEFALEAKCYDSSNSIGVKEMSRLISRLRHRQFGVLVSTSFVSNQAYCEIIEDEHPIIVISASDIGGILDEAGLGSVEALSKWLHQFDTD